MENKINIALVDDSELFTSGLTLVLKKASKNITVLFSATNGQELLEMLKGSKPDLILLDINMPVMDGRETLKRLKIEYPDIKVVILTTNSDPESVKEFMNMGATAYLTKHCSSVELIAAILSAYREGAPS